jgi:hypothetical protein
MLLTMSQAPHTVYGMRAKVVLIARVPDGKGNYPFLPVPFRKGRPEPVEGATAYYLRYSEGGKRKVEPVGANIDVAFSAFQNRDMNHERINASCVPHVWFLRRVVLARAAHPHARQRLHAK